MLGYWSLAAWLKHKVKNAVEFIPPRLVRDAGGVLYCNDGDWVESCTALVEDFDGTLSVLRWTEERARRRADGTFAAGKS